MSTTRKIVMLCIVFLFLLCFFPQATAFTVDPTEINVSGESGERIQKEATLVNLLNTSINITVNVSSSLTDLVSIPSSIEIPANGSIDIEISLWCNKTTGGFIRFIGDEEEETILISLNSATEEESGITIYPENVVAGKTFAFTVPSEFGDCSGFVFCEGSLNLYSFIVKHTVGSVALSPEDYGKGKIWIFIDSESKTKEFTIAPSYETVSFNLPEGVKAGDKKNIQLLIGDTPYRNKHITVTTPDDFKKEYDTNQNGEITVNFDIGGEWEVMTAVGDSTINDRLTVEAVQLEISLSEKKPVVDREFVITTDPNADVIVSCGSITWSHEADNDGIVLFTPLVSGTYEITASKGRKAGKKTFQTGEEVVVFVQNEKGDLVNKLLAGKQYTITVEDSEGPVIDIESIEVLMPNGEYDYIPINNGIGKWTPGISGSYTLSPFTTDYYSSSMFVSVVKTNGQSINMVAVAVIVIVIFILLIIAHRKGLLDNILLRLHLTKFPK